MSSNYKVIREFYRHFNFTSSPKDRKKCLKSVIHTLRIFALLNSNKPILDWNPELNDKNFILIDGKIMSLHQLSDERKMELLQDIVPPPKIKNKMELQKKLHKSRYALKKSQQSLKKEGNVAAASLVDIIVNKNNDYIDEIEKEWFLTEFEQLEMNRKSQRVKQLKTYLDTFNTLHGIAPENAIYTQECVFKIPSKWKVSSEIITAQEYIQFMQMFLHEHFPSYAIKSIIAHDDEREVDESVGLHIHCYLNARNEKTKEYDLRKAEISVINRHIIENRIDGELLPSDGNLTYKQSKEMGHYFQVIFQNYVNENLLNPKGLHAEFTPETEKQTEQYKHMNRQSKLPKDKRDFSFHTKRLENIKNQIAQTKEQHDLLANDTMKLKETKNHLLNLIEESESILDSTIQEVDIIENHRVEIADKLQAEEEELSLVSVQLSYAKSSLKKLEEKIAHTKEVLSDTVKIVLEQVLFDSFMLSLSKLNKGNYQAAYKKYINRVINKFNQLAGIKPLIPFLDGVKEVMKEDGIDIDNDL